MSYNIPVFNKIPNEQLFFNGYMTPAWRMFFQSLAKFADQLAALDIFELEQLANLQPPQAIQGTQGEQIEQLEQFVQSIPIPVIPQPDCQVMPLSQVAFLCPEEILPLSTIAIAEQAVLPSISVNCPDFSDDIQPIGLNDDLLQVISP